MQGQYYVVKNDKQVENAINYVKGQAYPFTVQCKAFKPPKTYPQLEKIHAMIKDISKQLKKDVRTVKIDVKTAFGIYYVYTSSIDGSRQVIMKSFADYTREELSTTLQALEAWCAEQGI